MIEKYLNKVWNCDCLEFMKKLPDNVIDCIITSPPYWGLRDYGLKPIVFGGRKDCEHVWGEKVNPTADIRFRGENSNVGNNKNKEVSKTDNKGSNFCQKCGAWKGQLGLEPTFEMFIDNLIEIFDECKRVLKKEGTMWVNLGDTFNGTKNGNTDAKNNTVNTKSFVKQKSYLQTKCLCNIPSRFAVAMTDQLQMILRNEIIWYKKNAMPSSAKDRFTVDFEKIYFFTKSPKYYFKQQLEQVRNMRTVWDITTKSFKEAHFATFPPKLVERCLKAGCHPKGIVYDPFMGAGTVALIALQNNINFIGTELNPDYIKIAENRLEKECALLMNLTK